tara:strand:- start:190 stop:438 length:249 start_codon:yes stop_codon:yes gene_type:complete
MKNLWQRLKPEYKQVIKKHQEKYSSAPQSMEKALKDNCLFCELTVSQLRDLFLWTEQDLQTIQWQDTFGNRFLINNNTGIEL